MDKEKHYPTHPGAEHPPIMTCEIPLEEYESLKRENEELKAKLESVQATAYTESVDAGMENRKLKRALWLARANRAMAETYSVLNDVLTSRWVEALNKLKAKAEEYK